MVLTDSRSPTVTAFLVRCIYIVTIFAPGVLDSICEVYLVLLTHLLTYLFTYLLTY